MSVKENGEKGTNLHTYSTPTHLPSKAELQFAVLHHVDAAVWLSGSEDVLALLELQEHHVLTQLQKQWLLKVAQYATHRIQTRT